MSSSDVDVELDKLSSEINLGRLVAVWEAWSRRQTSRRMRALADAAGDAEQDGLWTEHEQPGPGPLQALAAHRRLVGLLGSFRWHAVLDAREQGASWDDIARVLDEPVDAVRADFLRIVKGQERLTGVGLQTDHDAYVARARAALEGDPR